MGLLEKSKRYEGIYEPELPLVDTPAQETHIQKFVAYHKAHPEIYRAIEARAMETIGRISIKRIYEELRGHFAHLDNSYTADYIEIDKLAIRDALKNGEEVPGIELQRGEALVIR